MSPPRAALARTNGPLILQVMEPMGLRRIMTLILGFKNIIEFKSFLAYQYISTKTKNSIPKSGETGMAKLEVKIGNVHCHQDDQIKSFQE